MQPGYGYEQPAKRRSVWPWMLAGAAVLVLLMCGGIVALVGAGGKAVNDQIEHGSTDLVSHVTITSCKTDQFGFVEIGYTVKNASAEAESYLIMFGIKDQAGVRVGEAHGAVNELGAGQTAKDVAMGTNTAGAASKYTCVLERVN
jgi:hypothetical protein